MALEHLTNSKAPPAPPASGEKNDQRRKRSRRSPASPSDDLLASILVTLAEGGESPGAAAKSRYLHECDVCFKTFRSHQALGGHKASHRKSATVAAAEAEYEGRPSASDAVQSYPASDINPSGKAHVCKRCNMSFPSGQALGGHQRRHYVSPDEDLPGAATAAKAKAPATATATAIVKAPNTATVTAATASGVTTSDGGASAHAPARFDFDLNQLPDLDLRLGFSGDPKSQSGDDHEVESPMPFKKRCLSLGSLLSL